MNSINNKPKQLTLSEALQLAGNKNSYQFVMAFSLCMIWVLLSFQRATEAYLYQFPTFYCGGDTNTLIDEESACGRDDCIITQHDSLTSSLGLYCSKKYTRESIASMQFPGTVAGLILFGMFSNKFGRRPTMILGLIIFVGSYLCTYLGALYNFIPGLFAGCLLNAFSSIPLEVNTYFSIMECADKNFSDKSIVLMYAAWGVGQMLMNPVLFWLPYWKQLIPYFQMSFAGLLLLWFILFFKESPRYLLAYPHRCRQVVESIATFNGRKEKLPEGQFQLIKPSEQQEQGQEESPSLGSFIQVFRNKQSIKTVLLFVGVHCILDIIYAGTSFSLADLGLGFRGNILLSGFLEAVGYVALNFICDKLPRKRTMLITVSISTIVLLSFQLTGRSGLETLQCVEAGFLRLISTVQYSIFILFLTESLRVQDRSAGTALVELLSFLSSFTPFLLTLGQKMHMNQMAFMGVLSAIGLMFLIPIKQTKGTDAKSRAKDDDQQTLESSIINTSALIN